MPSATLIDPPSCKAVPGVTWDRLQRAYAAVCAERDALAARVAHLEAVLFRGHVWEQHGNEYRCSRCGMRAHQPRRVQFTCADWQAGKR